MIDFTPPWNNSHSLSFIDAHSSSSRHLNLNYFKVDYTFKNCFCFLLLHRWTGSNTNPRNNDGQGLAGSDRSNIVLLAKQTYPEGTDSSFYNVPKYGHYGRNFAMDINYATFLGLSKDDALTLAFVDPGKSIYVYCCSLVLKHFA